MNHSAKAVATIGTIAGIVVLSMLIREGVTKYAPPEREVEVSREFACYDDGKLVERHVSVQWAYNQNYNGWLIEYTDGNRATYVQDAGESCTIEEYIPDANATEG